MARLDIERQARLEPGRIASTRKVIEDLGYVITYADTTRFEFTYNEETVKFWPYSGWHSGKSIKDGRGFNNLLKQIKNDGNHE